MGTKPPRETDRQREIRAARALRYRVERFDRVSKCAGHRAARVAQRHDGDPVANGPLRLGEVEHHTLGATELDGPEHVADRERLGRMRHGGRR